MRQLGLLLTRASGLVYRMGVCKVGQWQQPQHVPAASLRKHSAHSAADASLVDLDSAPAAPGITPPTPMTRTHTPAAAAAAAAVGMTDMVWQQGLREFAGNRDKVGSLKAAGTKWAA